MEFERKDERSLCAELLEILWKDDRHVEHHEFVTLEDISATGLCLATDIEFPIGTKLVIKYPRGKYEGRVRYCQEDALGYQVGVQFEPGYQWSPRHFRPSHLLQFRLKPPES